MNARRPFDAAQGSTEPQGFERVAAIVVGAQIELGLLAFIAGVA